jgi:hypothetical protein
MTRSATLLSFPLPVPQGPINRAEIDAAIIRGRRLQGEALQSGLRRAATFLRSNVLAGGCLRGLRLQAGVTEKRQPCGCV